MKKKKIDRNQTIQKVNVGVFEIRFSIAKVEIENFDKTWRMIFASGTVPYATMVEMVRVNRMDVLESMCTGFYGTMSLCVSPGLLGKFMKLLEMERNGKVQTEGNK